MSSLSGRRVMITEDEVMVGLALEDNLKSAGCEFVGLASNYQSACDLLDREQIDLGILDINLGGETVFPLASKLRLLGIPFFFLTGYHRGQFVPPEFSDFVWLEKPVKDSLVIDTAIKLLESAALVL